MKRSIGVLIAVLILSSPNDSAVAQCYSSGYSYSYPATNYVNTYTPYYVPVAVTYPVPYYGSSYGGDGTALKELKDLKRELELEKIKQELAQLRQPAPQFAPHLQLTPAAPRAPVYAPPEQADYPPPARVPKPQYAPPVEEEECKTCNVPPQQQRAPVYRQPVPQQAPQTLQYAPKRMQQVTRAMTRGQHVGQTACASCHTPGQADDYGAGRIFFSDEVGLSWDLRPKQIERTIQAVAKGTMPPRTSGITLSQADRSALINHLRSLQTSMVKLDD